MSIVNYRWVTTILGCTLCLQCCVTTVVAGEDEAARLAAFFTEGIADPGEPARFDPPPQAQPLLVKSAPTVVPDAPGDPWSQLALGGEIRSAAIRAGLFFLGMCTVCGVTMMFGRRGRCRRGTQDRHALGIQGSLSVGPGIGIKVVHVGRQRIVVGYDRGGMRSMVVLPEAFGAMLEDVEADGRTLNLPQESYRPALARMLSNPKDTGWELNHTIPSLS